MKIIYRGYKEVFLQDPGLGKPPRRVPHDIEVPCVDFTVILRMDNGIDIEVTESPAGFLLLRSLNSQLGLAPSSEKNKLAVVSFPY